MRKVIGIVLMLGLVAGCESTPVSNPMPLAKGEYQRVFDAAEAVLADRGFGFDRRSERFGLIVTKPRLSRTMFEPVGNNNQTLRRQGQSTLRQLRRRVTVQLRPADTAPTTQSSDGAPTVATREAKVGYTVSVKVVVQAQQQPKRRLIGATGRRVFSNLAEVPRRWQARGISSRYWQRIDRDRELEQRLLQAIARRIDTPAAG
jgi:hypothetical protein